MKRLLFIIVTFMALTGMAQTLEECQQAAERNYPLIKQYDLIARTTDYTVANIRKAWLPQVTAGAQATLQSDVAAWPEQMQAMLNQMGVDLKGLKKDQYRVGIDLNQTIYDGGAIGSQAAVARAQGDVETAQTAVNLYAIRQRVNEMPQKIQRRRQPFRPGMVVQRHRAVFLHHGVWVLYGDDDGRMLRLLFRRRPDRRAVSLRERSGFDGSVRTGVWNEEHHGILPLRIVSFGQIDKIRQSHARIGIREIVLFEILYDQLSGSRRDMSRRTGGNDGYVGGPNVRRLHDGRAQIDRLSVILETRPIALSLPCAAIFFRVMTWACEEVRASGLPFVFISKAKEDETSGGGNVCLLRTGIRMRRNDLSALHGETFRSHRGRIKLS